MSRRDDLYNAFIVEASKAYGDAIASNEPQIQELVALYAMISRMRVLAFPRTVECAEKTMREVMETYTAPNRTMLELHELIKSGEAAIDPLKEFSEAAREELRAFTSTIGDESQARVGSGSENIAKHRQAALRFDFGRFVF